MNAIYREDFCVQIPFHYKYQAPYNSNIKIKHEAYQNPNSPPPPPPPPPGFP